MDRRLLVLPLIAALGACARSSSSETTGTVPARSNLETTVTAVGGAGATQQPIVILPAEAGAVSAVREQSYSNGATQQISFASESRALGENRVDISVLTAGSPDQKVINGVPLWKPSESGVKSEILNRMPGVAMSIVNREFQNAYGPFGLAIGRMNDGARCIFAWQYINDLRVKTARAATSPALLRVRLCRANATVDELASYVQNMRIVVPDSFGAARAGPVLTDVRGGGAQTASGGELDALVPVRRSAPAARVAQAPAPRATRSRAKRAAEPATQTIAPMVVQQPYYGGGNPYGQRYLAPVTGAATASPAYLPAQSAAPLAGDLPAQAYRGPSARTTARAAGQAQYQTSAPAVPSPGDATHSIKRPGQSVYYTGPQQR